MTGLLPPPATYDQPMPLYPMRVLESQNREADALRRLIATLVASHPSKLTSEQRDKLSQTYWLIVLNCIYGSAHHNYVAVSLRSTSYRPGERLWQAGLSYRLTKAVLDRMSGQEGLLLHVPGYYDPQRKEGKQSRFYSTGALWEAAQAEMLSACIALEDSRDSLVLKGFGYGADSLPPNHPDLVRLDKVNGFLQPYSWPYKSPLRLQYSGGPCSGGRLYATFQNMRREERRLLKINGRPTVELDLKANHPRMALTLLGLKPPDDPYLMLARSAGTDRETAKKFFSVALGAESPETAFNACATSGVKKPLFIQLETACHGFWPGLPLYKGIGVAFQSLEGQIALDVLAAGVDEGIPVLPVHDSFIAPEEHEGWLWKVIEQVWMQHLGTTAPPRIERK